MFRDTRNKKWISRANRLLFGGQKGWFFTFFGCQKRSISPIEKLSIFGVFGGRFGGVFEGQNWGVFGHFLEGLTGGILSFFGHFEGILAKERAIP